jgi:hypothetical protein
MIAELSRSTNNNIEHQGIEFVVHSLRPWLIRWEQAIRRDLIVQPYTYFAEFLVDGLLRGDSLTRSQALQYQFQNGIINEDEWRAIENRNPLPNGMGKRYFVPLNLIPADKIEAYYESKTAPPAGANQAPTPSNPKPEPPKAMAAEPFRILLADAAERASNAELRELAKRASKAEGDRDRFNEWAAEFYATHCGYIERTLAPIASAYESATGQPYYVHGIATGVAEGHMLAIQRTPNVLSLLNDWKITHLDRYKAAFFGGLSDA